jgi:hypothetical protein
MTLEELIAVVEAQGMGKRGYGLLAGSGGLNIVSDYQAGKGRGKYQDGRVHPDGGVWLGGKGGGPGEVPAEGWPPRGLQGLNVRSVALQVKDPAKLPGTMFAVL